MHGVLMIFFFLIPGIPAVLGNFLVPLMIGAKDLAFPKLNLASWYIFNIAGLFGLWAMLNGGVDTGWTFYTPFSTTFSNSNVIATALGAFIAGFASILTGLNFIVTIHRMRAPGLTWFRLPLFIWSHYATSVIILLGTPVVAITILLVAAERLFHIGVFDPAVGGDPDPLPAPLLVLLPPGRLHHDPAVDGDHLRAHHGVLAQAHLRLQGRGDGLDRHRRARLPGLGAPHVHHRHVGLRGDDLLDPHHAGRGAIGGEGVQLDGDPLQGLGLLGHADALRLGFIGLFTIGGLTGAMLATLGIDLHVHDTYFVVAHFHYIMVGGTMMGYLGGLHFWWPKITGRLYPVFWSKLAALIVFVGFNLTFFPQFLVGYMGMPRRYHVYPDEFQVLNVMSSAGATILGVGFLIPIIYFIWSMRYGKRADRTRGAPTASSGRPARHRRRTTSRRRPS